MKPELSVIIPVLNEKKRINAAIKRLFDQQFLLNANSPGINDNLDLLEVIVVDGSPKKETLACIEYDAVKKVSSLPGRGRQMNAGAAAASGNLLLFLHCDTALPAHGIQKILSKIKGSGCDSGAFDLSINAKGIAYRLIERTASLRSRLTKIPYGDQGIFVRKDFFFSIGRFKAFPIMEDVEFMQRVKKHKGKLVFIDDKVSTSSRRWEKEGTLYGTLRNWTLMTLYLLGVSPERLSGLYRNH